MTAQESTLPFSPTQDSAWEALQEAIDAIRELLEPRTPEPTDGDLCPCCGDFITPGHACQ